MKIDVWTRIGSEEMFRELDASVFSVKRNGFNDNDTSYFGKSDGTDSLEYNFKSGSVTADLHDVARFKAFVDFMMEHAPNEAIDYDFHDGNNHYTNREQRWMGEPDDFMTLSADENILEILDDENTSDEDLKRVLAEAFSDNSSPLNELIERAEKEKGIHIVKLCYMPLEQIFLK